MHIATFDWATYGQSNGPVAIHPVVWASTHDAVTRAMETGAVGNYFEVEGQCYYVGLSTMGVAGATRWHLRTASPERDGVQGTPRVKRIVPDHAKGIPGATVSFRATLTATTNEYLVDRLPLEGLVQIGERDVNGKCQFVTFMPDAEPGKNTSFVAVPNAEFTFASRF